MEDMSISMQVKERIGKIEPGVIFGLKDFSEIRNSQAVVLELSRLTKKGVIDRLTKGKYYIPKGTRFGKLGPSEWQILNRIIQENGGYYAGVTALNRIGVTTQIPSQVTIRGARSTRALKIGNLVVQLLSQGNKDADYKQSSLTDILEAIRLIRRTPDGSPEKTLRRLRDLLKGLSGGDVDSLISLSQNERPYVRAILGALLENIENKKAESIKSTLNPITRYKVGLNLKLLPNRENWGIF